VLFLVILVSCSSKVTKLDDGVTDLATGDVLLSLTEHSAGKATIEWEYQGGNPLGFRVLKKEDALPVDPAIPVQFQKYAVIAKLDSGVRIFTDDSVEPGESVSYVVRLGIDEDSGVYSNFVGSASAGDVGAPDLAEPIVENNDVVLNWISAESGTFQIYRDGTLIGSVSSVSGQTEYTFTDSPPSDGYYIYKIVINGAESEEQGVSFGLLAPGTITDFAALIYNDMIMFQWRWSSAGNAAVFIFDMHTSSFDADGMLQMRSDDENIEVKSGIYNYWLPITDLSGQITFDIYPKAGYDGAEKSVTVNTNTGSSFFDLSLSPSTIQGNSSYMYIAMSQVNGFITHYTVKRRELPSGSSNCSDAGATQITVVNNNKFTTAMNGVNPGFREYWGTSHPSLQRDPALNYCYEFTLTNSVNSVSSGWQLK